MIYLLFNITARNTLFALLEHLKNSKTSRVTYLDLELTNDHPCQQKQNPSRKTIPLKLGICRCLPIIQIYDLVPRLAILAWIRIRIRGSMPLTINGSGFGSGSCYFIIDLQALTKNYRKSG
jgi:hypothetical protein